MAFKDIILAVTMAVKKAKAYTDSKTSGMGGGVNYKGSVNYYSDLPANPKEGDAYTVKYSGSSGTDADGTEYVWGLNTDTNTMEWIEWSKDCYTKAEADTLLGAKQNTIDSTHKLSADNVNDSSSTNKFTNATEKQTWNGKQNAINSNNKLGGDVVDLTGYTAEADPTTWATPAATDTLDDAVKKLDNNTRLNKNNISLLETKVDTNTSILSQTYNSADCNVSVFLQQDNGAIDESTYYITSESKMHFRMHWSKNQLVYWDVEDEVYTNKYRYEYFGVIATNNVNKSTWLTIDIPEVANETYVKKTTTTDTTNLPNAEQGGYTWNKSSVNVGDIWYIRPYVVMTDLQFGNQFVKYGAVYKVTAGVPCTIECDTLSCTELTNNISTKIGASDYATQNTGGTVRVWTTTSSGETTLHIATQAP